MKMEKVKRFLKPSVYKVLGSVAGVALAGFIAITALADTPGTVTGDRVNVRSEANTTSTVLTKVTANESVTIIEETNGSDGNKWYKIKTSSGTTGYVRSDYIKSGSTTTTTTTTTPATTPNVTAIADKKAYIAGTDGTVNIRKSSTTNSDVVATAKAKSEITITGETTTDGYKWYQIKFTSGGNNMTGFIRSDLVTFTAPEGTSTPAETTIGGQTDPGTETGDPGEETSEVIDEPEPEETSSTASTATLQFLEPVGEPASVPAGYEKVDVMMGDQVYSAWAKGDFYIVYGISGNSDAQWYVYDYKNNSFVSFDGLFATTEKKEAKSVPLFVTILLGVVALALLVATIILAIKVMKGGNGEDYPDDYDIDYDDDDDDVDEEEDYDDYEEFDDDYEDEPVKTKKTIFPKKAEKAPAKEEYYDDEEEDEDEYYDDEEEDYEDERPAKKKGKKEKKSFKNKILDYFTVSDDDDEDDEDEYEDEDDYDEDDYDDSDTGDMSFIDL